MVVVYALALLTGFAAVAGFVLAATLAARPDSSVSDPAARFGDRGRDIPSAVLGFGLGGMSASFAGWSAWLAIMAAIGGAALLVVSIRFIEAGESEA